MKKILFTAAVAAIAAVCATQASAQDAAPAQNPVSLEIGVTQANVSDDYDMSFTLLTARAGFALNSNISLEAEGGFGLTEETVREMGVDVDFKIKWTAGAFVKAQFPVSDKVRLFGRLGYAKTEVSGEANGYEVTASGDGVAGGVGAEVDLGGANALRFDVTRYKLDDSNVDSVSLTLRRQF
jgi:outer membrane immunogenic protein